jgi:hypothetical protein
MWRTNTVRNIDVSQSLSPKIHRLKISAPPEWLLDLVNLLMIDMICPAMMRDT